MEEIKWVYHKTKYSSYLDILRTKHLYNQIDRKKNGITYHNEGSSDRKFAKSDTALKYKTYWKDYDEALGVYFRPYKDKIRLQTGEVAIILDFCKLVEKGFTWNVNTVENNGFYLTKPGIEAEGPYSGYTGITYNSSNWKQCKLENLNDSSEILIEESIYITPYLVDIIIKTEE